MSKDVEKVGRSPAPSAPGRAGGLRPEPASQSQPKALIPNAGDVLFTGAHPTSEGFVFGFRDGVEGGIIHLIAAHLADMMGLDTDKPLNCVQIDVQPAGKPPLLLTMQRAGGKSPLAIKAEARRLLEQTLCAIESGRSEPLAIMRDAIRNWLEADPASGIVAATAGETRSGSMSASEQSPAPQSGETPNG